MYTLSCLVLATILWCIHQYTCMEGGMAGTRGGRKKCHIRLIPLKSVPSPFLPLVIDPSLYSKIYTPCLSAKQSSRDPVYWLGLPSHPYDPSRALHPETVDMDMTNITLPDRTIQRHMRVSRVVPALTCLYSIPRVSSRAVHLVITPSRGTRLWSNPH